MDEELYTRGFNHGYELQKHDPEMVSTFMRVFNEESDYLSGFRDGNARMVKEKTKGVKALRLSPPNKYSSKDKDRGMDMER